MDILGILNPDPHGHFRDLGSGSKKNLMQIRNTALYTTYLFITEVEYINTRDAYSQPLECRKCIKIKIQSYQS